MLVGAATTLCLLIFFTLTPHLIMNCPRCKKDFTVERLSFLKWLETVGLDAMQTAYVMHNYGRPLCEECLNALKSSFYACETSPYLKSKTNRP